MVLLPPPSVCSVGASRPKLLVLLSTIPTWPFLQWSGPHLLNHLLYCYSSSSRIWCRHSLPADFFSSSSPWWGTPENPNGANSDGAHTRGCMCGPAAVNRTRSRVDANMERARPRMRIWYPQLAVCPWMPGLLVYFRLPFSPLLPFLHWSDWAPAGPSLSLWRLDVSSVDPVHLDSCDTLLFCSRAPHLQDRLHFIDSLCSSGAPTDALCHLRTCVMSRLDTVTRRHMTWRAVTTLRIFQRHKNDMKSTTLTWVAHVAVDDVRAFLAESWCRRESSWDPRVIRWRWWRTPPRILEQVIHREFDITSIRKRLIEDCESFAVIVISILDGMLVDALSLTQRINRMKCSRVMDVCTSDSSEEETRRWCAQILQSSNKKLMYYQTIRFCDGH